MNRNTLMKITSPLHGIWASFERDVRDACQPADGHYVTYEMTPTHWQIETNENGDVIHRRMSIDEVEALKTHSQEGNS